MRRNYNYRISALTMIELLRWIAFGDEAHFEQNREGLRIMYGPHSNMKFLQFPGVLLLRTALNDSQTKLHFEPSDLEKWVKVTLRAVDKEPLVSGTVILHGNSNISFGMALEKVTDLLQEGMGEHAQRLTDLRNGILQVSPSGEGWALGILNYLNADTSDSA